MSSYTYSIVNDTLNGVLDNSSLSSEITSSSITIALSDVSSSGDVLTINFKASLSTSEETELNNLVAQHSGEKEEDPQPVSVAEQPPFAKPNYRTKRDGTSSWQTVAADTNQVVDFILSAERYVTGGEIIYKNAKQGDYISAEVHDPNGVIPEAYRAALAENHPVVATHVIKKWLKPTEVDKYDSFLIDTYPLNAKITPGLSLRVTYHSSAEAGTREIAINYHLTEKLL